MANKLLTFQEALDWAKSRKVVLPEDYVEILDQMVKNQAFTIAGVASRDQLQMVLDSLSDLLENGGTWEEWKDKVQKGDIKLDLPVYRLDNIFRTNLQVHYNHGHWQQQKRHAKQRPYLMYDAVNDSRTRPNHLALDNMIRPIDDPVWQTYYPPIGYRCRCVTIALTEAQAKKRGGVTEEPEGGWPAPDNGWGKGVAFDPEKGTRAAAEPTPGGSHVLQEAMKARQTKEDFRVR